MQLIRHLRAFWRAETGLYLALWIVLLIGGRSRLFRDPGTFWHTIVGEQILSTGEFRTTDSFSYTFAGRTWIPHQWLGECTMALLHRVAGLDTLLLAAATLLAGLYTWAASRLLRAGLHWSLTAALLVLAVAASASHFHIRPHLGTMLFLAVSFAILCDVEARRVSARRLFWLVPIFLVWTNTHGGMLGGWCTLTVVVGGWGAMWISERFIPVLRSADSGSRPTKVAVLTGFGVMVLCGLTCLVNPFGVRMPQTWLEIMDSPILPQIIIEHSPLRRSSPEGLMVLVLGAVYVFLLAGLRPQWPRVTWLVPLIWLALTVSRIRHAPLFSLTALVAMADILPQTRWATWLARPGSDLFRFPTEQPKPGWTLRELVLPALVVSGTLLVQWSGACVPVFGRGWARLDPGTWPVDLLPELRAHEQDRSRRIFNEYAYGGFLIYYTPGYKVFVDDRCELYGDRWLLHFVEAETEDTGGAVAEMQQRYGGFDLALTVTGSGYDNFFRSSSDWQALRATPTATLYRRKS